MSFEQRNAAFRRAQTDVQVAYIEAEREVKQLKAENANLTKLTRWMYQVMDESCAVHYPYEPAPVSMQALMRAEKELQALGIEVDG